MAANPYGVNGPRMGKTHGRLRNSMLNQLSKMSGGRSYPSTLVNRPGGLPQSPTAPGPTAQAPTTPAQFQVSIPQRSPVSLEQPTVPLASATPVLDLSGGTEALNQAAQNLAVLAQLAGTRGQGSGTPGPGAGGGDGGNTGGGGGGPVGARPPIPTALNNVAANMRLARWMAANRGWDARQWKFLRYVVEGHGNVPGESGWRGSADNPTSSAIGIGQRLVSAHPWKSEAEKQHYLHNVQYQLAWMMNYIQSRYGTPEQAWAHKVQTHWY